MHRYAVLPAILLIVGCTMSPVMDDPALTDGSGSTIGQIDMLSSASSESSESLESSESSTSSPSSPSSILTVGSADAPTTLLLFTHHSCDYCKTFHEQLISRLDEQIRSDQLRLQIVPIILNKYEESVDQAKFLICATQQGKGMTVHGALFNAPTATVRAQEELGLDLAQLDTCLAAEETTQLLEAQSLFATSMDVELVPTYFVNDTHYQGLPEWADLRGQIELERKN